MGNTKVGPVQYSCKLAGGLEYVGPKKINDFTCRRLDPIDPEQAKKLAGATNQRLNWIGPPAFSAMYGWGFVYVGPAAQKK